MNNDITKAKAEKIRKHLVELTKQFEKDFIVIGGWAVNAYDAKDLSLDGDAMINLRTLSELRSEFEICPNSRLKKHQIIFGDYDLDLYVEHNHGLTVSFEEIQKHAVSKKGLWVPCPEHLLVLKHHAAHDRAGTGKGEKDKEDIIRLSLSAGQYDNQILQAYLDADQIKEIKTTLTHTPTLIKIYNNNSFQISKARKQLERISESLNIDSDDGDHEEPDVEPPKHPKWER